MGNPALAVRRVPSSFHRLLNPRQLDLFIRIAVVLWCVLLFTPWTPSEFDIEPADKAYTIFSSIAFAAGHPWGSGALHTGGPLGFFRYRIFYPPTFALLLIGDAAFGAVAGLLTYEVLRRCASTWARVLFTFAAISVLAVSDEAVWLFLLLLSEILIPEIGRSAKWSFRPDPEWLAWPVLLDLAACAIAANVKGQFLLMTGILAIQIALLELWSRRAPLISASLVLGVGISAQWAGFRIGDWAPYLKHIIGSLGGYAESFALAGSLNVTAGLLLSAFGLLTIGAFTMWRPSRPLETLLRWVGFSILVWIDVKGALSREDPFHAMRAIASLIVFFALYIVVTGVRQSLPVKITALIPAFCLCALFLSQRTARDFDGFRFSPEATLKRSVHQLLNFAREGIGPAQDRDNALRSRLASMLPAKLPPESSVAAFGVYQSLLLAHKGPVFTLPIVASYEIWTPWTDKRESDYLESRDAPEYLLYTASPSPADLAITLTRLYREVESGPNYRLLQRRPRPLSVNRRLILDENANALARIQIPREWQGHPAIAEIRYVRKISSTLISAFYQPPGAYLVAFDGDQAFMRIRMNPLLQHEGIVLLGSPGVWDGNWLGLSTIRYALLTDERSRVTAIGFAAAGPLGDHWTRYFDPTVRISIYVPEFKRE